MLKKKAQTEQNGEEEVVTWEKVRSLVEAVRTEHPKRHTTHRAAYTTHHTSHTMRAHEGDALYARPFGGG